ncbi:DUF6973 domain-containing protein [Paenibacillus terrae]
MAPLLGSLSRKHLTCLRLARRSFVLETQQTLKHACRHAVWNALMCRYISNGWAKAMATAHEDKNAPFFSKFFLMVTYKIGLSQK